MKAANLAILVGCCGAPVCSPAAAQVTQRVSVSSSEMEGTGESWDPSMSADGRYVAFYSLASDLVEPDTNGTWDVFVRDRQSGTTERISVSSAGVQSDGLSHYPSISSDGRFVAFMSAATNLLGTTDANNTWDVFVRDRQNGVTTRVSVSSAGMEAHGVSSYPSISADGRYVAFESYASDLVDGDTNGAPDIFVHDRTSGAATRVSVHTAGTQAGGPSYYPSISADGRFVAFWSVATDLVSGDMNGVSDAFVHDRQTGVTERVSLSTSGMPGDGDSLYPALSADGRYVTFESLATNLVTGDSDGWRDIYTRDRLLGATERVSISSASVQANGNSSGPVTSADGRYVAFESFATNLVADDTSVAQDIFVRDRQAGTTERVSVRSDGTQSNGGSYFAALSGDGRYVAFRSDAWDLVPGDTNGCYDVFVRDRRASGATSVCHPGVDGVAACPCSNDPAGPGRGCENSASTGGAVLSASGAAYLSMDGLVFTTSGQKPTAASIVVQGDAFAPNGIVFGQGVRCVAGSLKRLYTRSAVGGSISVPDVGTGDPTVSARSATLGDMIHAGASRYYFVYYRDPLVLGGCSALSTFNLTQTVRVEWSL